MATYPANIATFTTKVNNVTIVDESHPNLLQDEVVAIESIIGQNPHISTSPSSGGTFVATSTTYDSLNARLTNIETGIVADSHTQYVKVAGGSSIVASTSSTKGLVVKGASSQSANLQEWQNSSGTVLASVNADGGVTDSKLTPAIDNLYVLSYVFG